MKHKIHRAFSVLFTICIALVVGLTAYGCSNSSENSNLSSNETAWYELEYIGGQNNNYCLYILTLSNNGTGTYDTTYMTADEYAKANSFKWPDKDNEEQITWKQSNSEITVYDSKGQEVDFPLKKTTDSSENETLITLFGNYYQSKDLAESHISVHDGDRSEFVIVSTPPSEFVFAQKAANSFEQVDSLGNYAWFPSMSTAQQQDMVSTIKSDASKKGLSVKINYSKEHQLWTLFMTADSSKATWTRKEINEYLKVCGIEDPVYDSNNTEFTISSEETMPSGSYSYYACTSESTGLTPVLVHGVWKFYSAADSDVVAVAISSHVSE